MEFRPFQAPPVKESDWLGHVIPGSFSLQADFSSSGGGQMEIDRRGLLKATCLALTGLVPPIWTGWSADLGNSPILPDLHPLTKLLLQRAQLANTHTGPVDQPPFG